MVDGKRYDMRQAASFVHVAMLYFEITALLCALLFQYYIGMADPYIVVTHDSSMLCMLLVCSGIGTLVAACCCYKSRYVQFGIGVLGLLQFGGGFFMTASKYPELFATKAPLTAEERLLKFMGVSVRFDANGGRCEDNCRVVKIGQTYGNTMNLFPNEDRRYIIGLGHICYNISSMKFFADINATDNVVISGCYMTNAVPAVTPGSKWTYVVDMLAFDGFYSTWQVGQNAPTNWGVYAQLTKGFVPKGLKTGTRAFVTLEGTGWDRPNMADRACFTVPKGFSMKAQWRVSLFPGLAIDDGNYYYVEPGKTLKCPLPIPLRNGFKFCGWYDGDRRIDAESRVDRRSSHTLIAKWEKL